MGAKALKLKDFSWRQGATDSNLKPGDFPLGSSESRAAARAMLQRRTALSPYDEDCLILYSYASHLCGHADPDCKWLENTQVYIRGREISDELYGPPIPSHLDPEYPRRTFPSIYFQALHDRLPQPGDTLGYEELADFYSPEKVKAEVEEIQGSWARRLAETPCPFRYEDGKMLIRQKDGTWQANWGDDVPTRWSHVEDEAFGRDFGCYLTRVVPERPTICAVVFIQSKDKKRRVKPLEAEADLPRMETGAASIPTTP